MERLVQIAAEGNLNAFMRAREKGVASAVTRAVRAITGGLQRELRRQVRRAKFQSKGLEQLVRARTEPRKGYTPDAEGLVYSNARVMRNGEEVDLLEVFDSGATIKSKGGKWLAIPTDDAAAKRSNPFGGLTKFRPGQLQKLRERASQQISSGKDMRIARRKQRGAYKLFSAIKDSGKTDLKFVPTKKADVAMLAYIDPHNGVMHVAYWLVKQVTIRKRIDINRAKTKWLPRLEPRINANLDKYAYKTGDDV